MLTTLLLTLQFINPPTVAKPTGYTHAVKATGCQLVYLSGLAGSPFGSGLWMLKVPKGENLIPFSLGVLGRSMVGRQGKPKLSRGAPLSSPIQYAG